MKRSLLNLIIISILLFFSACGPYWYKPYGRIFTNMPKNSTPGFQLGWIHGCQSGLGSQFGGAIYMTFYTWERDPDLITSKPDFNLIRQKYGNKWKINWDNIDEVKKNLSDYKKIFWGAHIYCRHSVLGILQTAGANPPLPGETRYNPAAWGLGNVYKIDGRGDARWTYW